MDFAKRFKAGLDVGLNSFGLLWQHKRLILYMGAPILLGIAFELIIYNLFSFSSSSPALFAQGIMMRIWGTFGWIRHLGIVLTQVIRLFVTIFAAVALTHHAAHILKGHNVSIRQTIAACTPKLRQIIIWSVIAVAFFFVIHQVDAIASGSVGTPFYLLAAFVGISSRIIWSLATLFVVTGIALEQLSLKHIIKTSPSITKKFFAEYLGAMFWIGLVGILAFTPFLLVRLQSPFTQTVVYIILAFAGCVLSTVHTILKTILYQSYKDVPFQGEALLPPI